MRRSIPRIPGWARRGLYCLRWRWRDSGYSALMRVLIGFIFVSIGFAQTPAPAPLKDQAWSIITDALGDKNPDTRVQAVQSMGLIGVHEPYISTLEASLDDKDVEVRVATVTSLVDLKNKGTVPALKKALG